MYSSAIHGRIPSNIWTCSLCNEASGNSQKLDFDHFWYVVMPYRYCSLWMNMGKDPSEWGRHQALAVFIEDHGLIDTSIAQRTQESNSIGSGRRYGLLACNVCILHCFHVRVEWCSLWQPPLGSMSRISTTLADQIYSTITAESRKPTHVSNRSVNRTQSTVKTGLIRRFCSW